MELIMSEYEKLYYLSAVVTSLMMILILFLILHQNYINNKLSDKIIELKNKIIKLETMLNIMSTGDIKE